jgi:hypothetical protein
LHHLRQELQRRQHQDIIEEMACSPAGHEAVVRSVVNCTHISMQIHL